MAGTHPEGDHTSVWRRIGAKGYEPTEVFVSQPYGFESWKDEMIKFANANGLCFWVSERPAWHYPGSVMHVEWTRPDSKFAKRRGTPDADELQHTVFRHGQA